MKSSQERVSQLVMLRKHLSSTMSYCIRKSHHEQHTLELGRAHQSGRWRPPSQGWACADRMHTDSSFAEQGKTMTEQARNDLSKETKHGSPPDRNLTQVARDMHSVQHQGRIRSWQRMAPRDRALSIQRQCNAGNYRTLNHATHGFLKCIRCEYGMSAYFCHLLIGEIPAKTPKNSYVSTDIDKI